MTIFTHETQVTLGLELHAKSIAGTTEDYNSPIAFVINSTELDTNLLIVHHIRSKPNHNNKISIIIAEGTAIKRSIVSR